MTRLRMVITVEYSAHNINNSYGTEDPDEMAAVDLEQFTDHPEAVCEMIDVARAQDDGSLQIRVDPV